jgi:hypothetical protein
MSNERFITQESDIVILPNDVDPDDKMAIEVWVAMHELEVRQRRAEDIFSQ